MIPYCETPRQSVVFGITSGIVAGLVSVQFGLSSLAMLSIAIGLALLLEAGGHAGVIELGLDDEEAS